MSKMEEFIESFIKSLKNKELVGIELMDQLKYTELVEEIHRSALMIISNSNHVKPKTSKFIVFASLILIAIENYNGNFWDPAHNTYQKLSPFYNISKWQSYESAVREMISEFYIGPAIQTRKINWLLMQAIVPAQYLFDYFDMMLEVYTYDLRASLPDDDAELDDVMTSIIGQISRKNYSSEDKFQSKVSNQAYRLIQSTRDAMKSKIYRRSVVKFSRVILKMIDHYVQNRSNYLQSESFITSKMDEWFDEKGKSRYDYLRRHFHDDKKRKPISWKPTFILKDQRLYLVTKTIFLPEDIDFSLIKIRIQSNQKDIYIIDKPEILSDDGLSAELSSNEIAVNFSPFNLVIKIDGLDIPDYHLNNEFLVFNQKGRMVKGVSDKAEKKYYIISNDLVNTNVQIISKNQFFVLSFFDSENNEYLILNDNKIPTKHFDKIVLSGEKIRDAFLQVGDKRFEIYKNDISLVVPNENRYSIIQVWINNHLQNIKLSGHELDNYIVALDVLEEGINHIKFLDQNSQNFVNQDNFSIFIDNNFSFDYKITDNKIVVSYSSTLTNQEKRIFEWPLEHADNVYDTIVVENIPIRYVFILEIPMYKKENHEYQLFPEYLYHSDFGFYEKLTIKGINASTLALIGEENQVLQRIEGFKSIEGCFFTFDVGILKTTFRNQNIRLNFMENDCIIYSVDYLNHITFESQDFIINSDPIKEEIELITGNVRGKGNIEIRLKNEEIYIDSATFNCGEIHHKFKITTSPIMLTIEAIDQSKNLVVQSKTVYYYTKYDLLHASYKIKEVALGINKRINTGSKYTTEYNDGMDLLRYTYVNLQRYDQMNNCYFGKLYFLNKEKVKIYFKYIQNVKIEIPKLIQNPKEITAYVYFVEDEENLDLIYDRKYHKILDIINPPERYIELCFINEILMEKVEKRYD